jgi:ATP-dependent Lhr-like helicase
MHPHLEAWFAERGWAPFPFQRDVWAAYLAGRSGLIHSATGSGKTLAAYLGPVIEWLEAHPDFMPQPVVESPVAPAAAAAPAKPPRPVTLKSLRRKTSQAAKSVTPARTTKSVRTGSAPLTVLWITPMRALAADTQAALEKPIDALGLPWTVGARTGDTSSAERARQSKRLPTVLVTTP